MATFTITDHNKVTVFASAEEAAQTGDSTATSFDSQAGLAMVSADWPLSRFVDIWNSIPGNAEVKKFADRKKAVVRIWNAIQPLAGSAQPREGDAEPKQSAKAAKPPKAAKPAKKAKGAKKAAPAKKRGDQGEPSNKKAEVIAMMRRAKVRRSRKSCPPPDGRSIPFAASFPSWAARAANRLSPPRTPQVSGRTASQSRATLSNHPLQTPPRLRPGRLFSFWRFERRTPEMFRAAGRPNSPVLGRKRAFLAFSGAGRANGKWTPPNALAP